MDFEPRYTLEQEDFRQEVRDWLAGNLPPDIEHTPDPIDLRACVQSKIKRA